MSINAYREIPVIVHVNSNNGNSRAGNDDVARPTNSSVNSVRATRPGPMVKHEASSVSGCEGTVAPPSVFSGHYGWGSHAAFPLKWWVM